MKKATLKLSMLYLVLGFCSIGCIAQKETKVLWTVAWSPSGNYIATGGDQGNLKIFDAINYKLIKTYAVEDVQLSRIKWHPTKDMLAIITQSNTVKARILDLETESWTDLEGLKSSLRALDWNSTGELLAVSELEKAVSVYSSNGKIVSRFLADPKAATGLDWHPNKNIMVTVGSQVGIYNHLGDTLKIWKTRKDEPFLLCVEWHRSGDFFVVGDYGDLENAENKMIQFWNEDGVKLNEIIGGTVEYRNIRWNSEGDKLASASEALKIWSKDGKLLAESKSSEDYLWGVDWSPDGKYIVTSSKNGKIIIRDAMAMFIKELKY